MLNYYIHLLSANRAVFEDLFRGLPEVDYSWREREEKWNLKEVVCHLYDEEREDFRARIQSVFADPSKSFTPIDPQAWVKERNYDQQDYEQVLTKFLNERDNSISWLKSLKNPEWNNAFIHPKKGPVSARFLLVNWLAHDYLHIRQIIRIKYHHLQFSTAMSLDYAGDW